MSIATTGLAKAFLAPQSIMKLTMMVVCIGAGPARAICNIRWCRSRIQSCRYSVFLNSGYALTACTISKPSSKSVEMRPCSRPSPSLERRRASYETHDAAEISTTPRSQQVKSGRRGVSPDLPQNRTYGSRIRLLKLTLSNSLHDSNGDISGLILLLVPAIW